MKLKISIKGAVTAVVLLGLLVCAVHYYRTSSAREASVMVDLENFPETFGDWTMISRHGLNLRSRGVLQLDRFVKRRYQNSAGDQIFLYIGYWAKQSGGHQAAKHSPRVCLPANGWQVVEENKINLTFSSVNPPEEIVSNRVVAQLKNRESLFLFWFFTGLRNFHQDWKALALISLENLLHGRTDGGLVEVSVEIPKDMERTSAIEHAEKVAADFLNALYPELREKLKDAELQAPPPDSFSESKLNTPEDQSFT